MQRILLGILLSAFVGVVGLAIQASEGTGDLLRVNRLFTNLAGHWACAGAFADGRPLSSDITITLRVDGRAVHYQHHDRAPNDFLQEALWGPDTQNNQLVSVAFAGNATAVAPQLLVAKVCSVRSIVFEARPLTSPPFAPNRFTYTIEPTNTLKMVWEVERNGAWSVGDRISCNRTS